VCVYICVFVCEITLKSYYPVERKTGRESERRQREREETERERERERERGDRESE